MREIKFTLIADGSSDKTLIRIIKWLLDDLFPTVPNRGLFADFRHLPSPPKTLKEKIVAAKNYYPYDFVFIHRDAEKPDTRMVGTRLKEIEKEIGAIEYEKAICVVPVKMMETWLLINELAIIKASSNKNYQGKLALPPISKLEKEPQPKKLLHELIKKSIGLKGRNLRKLNLDKAVHLVAENISNFQSLRELKSFQLFEKNVRSAMTNFISYII